MPRRRRQRPQGRHSRKPGQRAGATDLIELLNRNSGKQTAPPTNGNRSTSRAIRVSSDALRSGHSPATYSGMLFSPHEPRNVPERFVALIPKVCTRAV